MKRTEKSKANSRQKSRANGRQDKSRDKSRANSRQSKPKDYDRDVRGRNTVQRKATASQPVQMSCRSSVAKGSRPSQRSTSTRKSLSTRKSSRQLRSSDTESPEDRGGFSQLEADVRWQSAQQAKLAAMSFDERKTFVATKEDLEQNTAETQKAPRAADVPVLQDIDTTVDVPVAKALQKNSTRAA